MKKINFAKHQIRLITCGEINLPKCCVKERIEEKLKAKNKENENFTLKEKEIKKISISLFSSDGILLLSNEQFVNFSFFLSRQQYEKKEDEGIKLATKADELKSKKKNSLNFAVEESVCETEEEERKRQKSEEQNFKTSKNNELNECAQDPHSEQNQEERRIELKRNLDEKEIKFKSKIMDTTEEKDNFLISDSLKQLEKSNLKEKCYIVNEEEATKVTTINNKIFNEKFLKYFQLKSFAVLPLLTPRLIQSFLLSLLFLEKCDQILIRKTIEMYVRNIEKGMYTNFKKNVRLLNILIAKAKHITNKKDVFVILVQNLIFNFSTADRKDMLIFLSCLSRIISFYFSPCLFETIFNKFLLKEDITTLSLFECSILLHSFGRLSLYRIFYTPSFVNTLVCEIQNRDLCELDMRTTSFIFHSLYLTNFPNTELLLKIANEIKKRKMHFSNMKQLLRVAYPLIIHKILKFDNDLTCHLIKESSIQVLNLKKNPTYLLFLLQGFNQNREAVISRMKFKSNSRKVNKKNIAIDDIFEDALSYIKSLEYLNADHKSKSANPASSSKSLHEKIVNKNSNNHDEDREKSNNDKKRDNKNHNSNSDFGADVVRCNSEAYKDHSYNKNENHDNSFFNKNSQNSYNTYKSNTNENDSEYMLKYYIPISTRNALRFLYLQVLHILHELQHDEIIQALQVFSTSCIEHESQTKYKLLNEIIKRLNDFHKAVLHIILNEVFILFSEKERIQEVFMRFLMLIVNRLAYEIENHLQKSTEKNSASYDLHLNFVDENSVNVKGQKAEERSGIRKETECFSQENKMQKKKTSLYVQEEFCFLENMNSLCLIIEILDFCNFKSARFMHSVAILLSQNNFFSLNNNSNIKTRQLSLLYHYSTECEINECESFYNAVLGLLYKGVNEMNIEEYILCLEAYRSYYTSKKLNLSQEKDINYDKNALHCKYDIKSNKSNHIMYNKNYNNNFNNNYNNTYNNTTINASIEKSECANNYQTPNDILREHLFKAICDKINKEIVVEMNDSDLELIACIFVDLNMKHQKHFIFEELEFRGIQLALSERIPKPEEAF